MDWKFTPYAVPLYVGAVLLLGGVVIAAWRRRTVPAAVYLVWVCVLLDTYALAYAMELSSTSVGAARFWLKVEYLAIPGITAVLLLMVLDYTGYGRYITRWTLVGVLVLPTITVLMAWTNDCHELVWENIRIERVHGFTGTLFRRGFWHWTQTLYTYVMLIPMFGMLMCVLFRATGLYRLQYTIILIGAAIPVGTHVLHLAQVIPNGLDITPYAFLATGIASGTGILYYHLFDVVPVAHETIVASMRDAVIVLDAQRRVLVINPAAQKLLGVARADVITRPLTEALPPYLQPLGARLNGVGQAEDQAAGRSRVTRKTTKAVPTPTAPAPVSHQMSGPATLAPFPPQNDAPPSTPVMPQGEEALEITVLRDGEIQVIDVRPHTLRRRNAQLAGYLLVLRDITARQKADQERIQLIAELDAFAHTVAHDIKNPLAVILGYSQMLGDELGEKPSALAREYIETISMYSEKVANIVNELLLLASARKQKAVAFKRLDMGPIVRDALDRLMALKAKYKAEIIVPGIWPVACGYSAWVEEIWANYISNAIKYGGTPPRVELGSDMLANGRVRFWVRDNGPGLSGEQQAQLFTPFTRLQEAHAEGHGLGLSIVRRIADKMDGEVGVESAPLQGSLFYFVLPSPAGESMPDEQESGKAESDKRE